MALLAVCWTVPTAGAAQDDFRLVGPLRARDMTPFGLLVLDMTPPYAVQDVERGWAVEVNFQTANNWLPSKSALEYLEGRSNRRAPLTPEDVDALLALDEDVFFADGGIQLIAPTFHFVWNRRWAAYLTLPVLLFNGGITDSTIESFHEQFGFGSQGRELMARNEFSVVANLQGASVATANPTDGGFTDPVLGIRRSSRQGKWGFAVEAAAKISLADEDEFLSTGSADFGLQLLAQRQVKRHGFSLAVNHVWVGGDRGRPAPPPDSLAAALAAWEWGATKRGSLLLQLYVRDSSIEKSTDPEITAEKIQATIGWRVRTRRMLYSFAFTENIETMNNTPDIGWHVSVTWLSKDAR